MFKFCDCMSSDLALNIWQCCISWHSNPRSYCILVAHCNLDVKITGIESCDPDGVTPWTMLTICLPWITWLNTDHLGIIVTIREIASWLVLSAALSIRYFALYQSKKQCFKSNFQVYRNCLSVSLFYKT